MASLWKRPESKYWFACFTGADGKRRKMTTKTTDRRLALKIASQFEEAYRNHRTATHVEKVIRRAHEELTGEKTAGESLADYVQRWLKNKRAEGVMESSMQFYTRCADGLVTWMGTKAKQPVAKVTKADLQGHRDHLAKTLGAKTVQHRLTGIRMLFKSAREEFGIENPAEFLRSGRAPRASKKPSFTADNLKVLLGALDGEWRTLVLLGIYTGARLADLQNLEWQSVDLGRGLIGFTTRKTGRVMRLPIAPPLARHLASLTPSEGPLVPGLAARRSSKLSSHFATILRQCKLRPDKEGTARGTPQLSFHSLRHSLVSLLKEAGASASVAMEFAGHDSAQMSEHYTTVSDESMRKAAEGLPDLFS